MPPFSEDQRREIGARIRAVRQSLNGGKGLSTGDMANRLGVSFSHLSKAEAGINSFSSRFVESVSREFGISLDWLLTGEGDMMGTCEVSDGRGGYVVRMVEQPDPEKIADLVMDPDLMVQAKGVAKILGCTLREAVVLVVSKRMGDTPSKS